MDYVGDELELFRHALNWKRHLHSQIEPFIGDAVLEVGAGIGATTQALCQGTRATRWLCLEPDESLARQIGAGRAACREFEIAVQVGTIADLGTDLMFDTILYVDVLEHIIDDKEELRRAARHLSPEGHLVVVSPAHQGLYSSFDRRIGHHRRYSRAALASAAPPGLRLARLRYLDSAGLAASLANRVFLRQSLPTQAQIRFWDAVLVPVSMRLDKLLGYCFGKSILAVWERS